MDKIERQMSRIGWTDFTENFWCGCTHATYLDGVTPRPACLRCYAEAWSKRTGGKSQPQLCEWGDDKPRHRTSNEVWSGPLKWNQAALEKGRRMNVFVDSLSDICDRADPRLDDWRREAFEIMDRCPNLNWRLLTKRIHLAFECFQKCMPKHWGGKFPPNFWLGCTVEDQRAFDEQWPLLAHASKVYGIQKIFFSMEPLFERVNILQALLPLGRKVDWIILGGESGAGCSETILDQMIATAQMAHDYDVPLYIKQMGSKPRYCGQPVSITDAKGEKLEEMPTALGRFGQHHPRGTFIL